MSSQKIALAQINPLLGDLAGNAQLIHKAALEAYSQGAKLVITPELSLTGYPPDAKFGSASADDKIGIPSSGGENSGVTRRLVRLPLTWEALHSSGSRLFVLDAYAVAPECTGSHLSASDGP